MGSRGFRPGFFLSIVRPGGMFGIETEGTEELSSSVDFVLLFAPVGTISVSEGSFRCWNEVSPSL